MRKLIYLSFLLLITLASCNKPQKPEFNRMQNTRILKLNYSEILITTDAVFDNPNGFGITVSSIDMIAKANDVESAKIKQTEDVEIISNSEFAVPLEISLKPKDLLTIPNILKLVTGSLEQKVTLNYSGTATLKVLELGYDIPIDYTEEILLKKKSN